MTQRQSKKKMAERRAQRRRQSQTRLIIGIAVTVVVVVGLIAVLTLLPPGKQPEPSAYAGLNQEIDQSGAIGIAIGQPNAPVTLVEYSDFSCTHCQVLSKEINTLITQYVSPGQLRVIYKPVSFVNPPYSEPASQAAICAAQQGKGWQMIDYIWKLPGPTSYNLATFSAIDPKVGLDTAAFQQCFNAAETAQAAKAVNDEATGKGIQGTPTVYVNGTQVDATEAALTQAIQAALGG